MKKLSAKRVRLLALTLCAALSICCLSACTSRKDGKKDPQTGSAPVSSPAGSAKAPDGSPAAPPEVSPPAPASGDDVGAPPSASAQDIPESAAPGSAAPSADPDAVPGDSPAEDPPEDPSGQETDGYSFHIEGNGDIVLPEV